MVSGLNKSKTKIEILQKKKTLNQNEITTG